MMDIVTRINEFRADYHRWSECFAFFREIKAAIVEQQDETDRLREALQELVDWQNGPPLSSQKWLDGWGGAMKKAQEILQAAERQKGKNEKRHRHA